jgi:hypothetical protein
MGTGKGRRIDGAAAFLGFLINWNSFDFSFKKEESIYTLNQLPTIST